MTKDGVPMWKPPVNNGTDLWEANLRNGGQPPPPQQAKTPWGHTPSTNIGGTWGEDDDAADTSNMWTGAPAPSQPNAAPWPGAAGNQASMYHIKKLVFRFSKFTRDFLQYFFLLIEQHFAMAMGKTF